jgi:hypothetical protein
VSSISLNHTDLLDGVGAQTAPDRMAQPSCRGPLEKVDLAGQRGAHPTGGAQVAGGVEEGAAVDLQAAQRPPLGPGESAADGAGEDQASRGRGGGLDCFASRYFAR